MKTIKNLFLLISLVFSPLLSDNFNYDNDSEWEDHPHKDDPDFPLHINYYQANKRWKDFKAELDWYMETDLSREIQLYKSKIAEKENLSKNELEISRWLLKREEQRYKIRCKALDNLKKSLDCFIENAVECIYCTQCDPLNFVGRRHGDYMRSRAEKEVIDLLTHYLEKELFPYDWKEKYANDQRMKKEENKIKVVLR